VHPLFHLSEQRAHSAPGGPAELGRSGALDADDGRLGLVRSLAELLEAALPPQLGAQPGQRLGVGDGCPHGNERIHRASQQLAIVTPFTCGDRGVSGA
jgi:hypothetical protein